VRTLCFHSRTMSIEVSVLARVPHGGKYERESTQNKLLIGSARTSTHHISLVELPG